MEAKRKKETLFQKPDIAVSDKPETEEDAKKILEKRGLLSERQKKLSYNEIKKEKINAVQNIFMNHLEEIGFSKEEDQDVIDSINNFIKHTLEVGIRNNKENCFTVDIEENKIETAEGNSSSTEISLPDGDGDIEKFIMVHNHTNGTTFSAGDIITFINQPKIKQLWIVGQDEQLYIIQRHKGDNIENNKKLQEWKVDCEHLSEEEQKKAKEEKAKKLKDKIDKVALQIIDEQQQKRVRYEKELEELWHLLELDKLRNKSLKDATDLELKPLLDLPSINTINNIARNVNKAGIIEMRKKLGVDVYEECEKEISDVKYIRKVHEKAVQRVCSELQIEYFGSQKKFIFETNKNQ